MSGNFSRKVVAGVQDSYEVARKIALAKKSHNLGETLILPCCKDIISLVIGEEAVEKLSSVSLSNNTICRRITDMSFNILNQVVEKIKKSTFGMYAIQLDETTGNTNLAQLCIYVRYVHNAEFEDEFLFCEDLKSRTTAKDIFEKVSIFFEEHDLDWQNLCGVCTDGAPAMLGHKSGFQTLVKSRSPNMIGSHCMLHRHALIMKNIPELLKNVLNDVIKTINTIKASALNSRLFTLLCEENDSDFKTLLLHSQVRWLSKGKALERVYILREEISEFLKIPQTSIQHSEKNLVIINGLLLWPF